MKTSCWIAALKNGAWGILLFNMLLLAGLHDYTFSSFIFVLVLLGWVILSSLAAALALPFFYQKLLSRWWYWTILLGLIVSDVAVYQDLSTQAQTLPTLTRLIAFLARFALITSLTIQLAKRNFGLRLLAWLSLFWIWSVAIFVLGGTDIVEALLQAVSSEPSLTMWWIANLGIELILLVPFALASFLWHSGCTLLREVRDASPSLRSIDGSRRIF